MGGEGKSPTKRMGHTRGSSRRKEKEPSSLFIGEKKEDRNGDSL